jgi:hypothetical protein
VTQSDKQKNVVFIPEDAYYQGVVVEYHKDSKQIHVSAWYDSDKDIAGGTIPLADFLNKLGVTRNDLENLL